METSASGSVRDRGLAALRAGRVTDAVQLLSEAVAADASDVQALALLGAAYGQMGDNANAIANLEKAAQLSPQAGIWFNLGVAYRKAGQIEEAREAMRSALAADPSHQKARSALQSMGEPAAGPPPMPAPAAGLAPLGAGPFAAPEADASPGAAPLRPAQAAPTVPNMPANAAEAAAWTPPPKERSTGNRLLAGLGWGALTMGLWQGAWGLFFGVLFGGIAGAKVGGAGGALAAAGLGGLLVALVMGLGGAVFGGISGLIIAALGASEGAGAVVGAAGNVLFRLGERLILGGSGGSMATGVIVGVLVGSWLGKIIAAKVRGDGGT